MENNRERSAKVFGHRQAISDGPVYPTLYGKFQLQTKNFLWLLVKMHSLLWNMPHSWYAHMIILQCHSHLSGNWSKNFVSKSYTSAKSLPCGAEPTNHTIKKVCSKCALLDLVKAYISPRMSVLPYTDKHWKADKVVFARRHNLPKYTTLGELLHNYQVI